MFITERVVHRYGLHLVSRIQFRATVSLIISRLQLIQLYLESQCGPRSKHKFLGLNTSQIVLLYREIHCVGRT